MRIKNLQLTNFRTIKSSLLDFTNGITLFTGDNGSGKSTILQALSLHLFNYTTQNLEDYIRWGESFFETSMEFEHNGKLFKQNIKYSRKVSERDLTIDKELYKNSDAVKILSTYFDPKLSLASIISFEGEIDLIQVKPSQRREYLKKIYDLEFTNAINDLDIQQKELENTKLIELDKNIFFYENKQYNYKQPIPLKLTEEDYTTTKVLRDSLRSQINNYIREIEVYRNNKTKLDKINNQIIAENNSLEANKTKINLLESSHNLSIVNLEKEIENQRKELSEIKLKRFSIFDESILSNKNKDLAFLEKDLVDILETLEMCKKGKCPTCGKGYTMDEIGKYETEKENIEIAIESLQLEISNLEELKSTYKKEEKEQQDNRYRMESIQKSIEYITNTIQSKKLQYESEKNYISEAIAKSGDRIKTLNEDMNLLNSYFQNNVEPMISANHYTEVQRLDNLITEYDNTLTINLQISKDNELLEKEEVKDKELLLKYRADKETAIDEVDTLKKCKSILQKEFPNFVISNTISSIERNCNSFINKTYDGRYQLKIKEKKDSLIIVYGEQEKECTSASGYEKQLFSLAWKFALGKLQNLGIIILDEVDSQATEQNSEKLFNIIGNMKDLYNQIFIITHRENTKNILEMEYNAKIYEAKDNNVIKIN